MRALSEPPLISPLGELELMNALQLRVFRKEIQLAGARSAEAAFRTDLTNGLFILRGMSDDVFDCAIRRARKWTRGLGVRSVDTIDIAAALTFGEQSFETSINGNERWRKPPD